MKKVINGVLCDTKTARLLGEYQYSNRRDFYYWREELYRTKSGRYFLYGEGGPASRYAEVVGQNEWSSGEKIELLPLEAAQQWAEEYLDGDEYIAAFGEPDEDKVQISLNVQPRTRELLEQLKEAKKLPFGEIVDRAISKMAEDAGIS